MITKEGSGIFKGIAKGLGSIARAGRGAVRRIKPVAPKQMTTMDHIKDFGKEVASQSLWSSPFDAIALAGGASVGSVISGNVGGALTGRMLRPLTSKIKRPFIRGAADFVGAAAGDMAFAELGEKYMPIWKRNKQPKLSSPQMNQSANMPNQQVSMPNQRINTPQPYRVGGTTIQNA